MYQPPPPPPQYSAMPPSLPISPQQQPQGSGSASIGVVLSPSIIGILRSMEKEDLQRLDESTIDNLLSDDRDLRDFAEKKATEQATNRSLAEHNLTFQAGLDKGKRDLVAAHKEAFELGRVHTDLRTRLQGGGGGQRSSESMESLHTLLQSAVLEAEEQSEALMETLLAKRGVDLAQFIDRYIESRTLYHTRRAKADKVNEISNQRIIQVAAFRPTETGGQPAIQPQQAAHYMQQPFPPQQGFPPQQPPPMPNYYYPAPPPNPGYGGFQYGGRGVGRP